MSKALIIDPRIAGCSGDMFLSSIIDLTESKEMLDELVSSINTTLATKMSVKVEKLLKKGINSTHLVIDIEEDLKSHHASDLMESLKKVLDNLNLSSESTNKAQQMLKLNKC